MIIRCYFQLSRSCLEPNSRRHAQMVSEYFGIRCHGWSWVCWGEVGEGDITGTWQWEAGEYFLVSFWESNCNLATENTYYSIHTYIHTYIYIYTHIYDYLCIYIYRCGKFIGKSQNAGTSFTDGGYHERRVHNVPWRISARTRKRQRKLAAMQLRQLETVSYLGAPNYPAVMKHGLVENPSFIDDWWFSQL